MSSFYTELRPAYVGEASYAVTVTIDGSGSIAGQAFSASLLTPGGATAPGTPTAVVSDAALRQVLVTLPGQTTPGDHVWKVTRTDDGSNLIVAHGVIEITNPNVQ